MAASGRDDFESFFRGVFPRAVAVAQRVTGDRASAEDAAVEALAKAHFRWKQIGGQPSRSSQNGLLTEISQLGTNLLTVQNGQALGGSTAELPAEAPAMISRLPGVTAVQDTGAVNGLSAYRSPLIPAVNTNGLSVDAASVSLPAAAGTTVAQLRASS